MATHPIVQFDYDFSPFGQKIRNTLASSGISFQRNDVTPVLPRPTLEKLGITYRRIPVLAIGKDVYADTSLIIDTIQKTFRALPTHPADKAFEIFGAAGIFGSALNMIPTAALTPEFIRDRETIFPGLARPDYADIRPSGLAEMREQLQIVEHQFLASSGGPYIGGTNISLADIHVGFAVKWLLLTLGLGQEPGFEEKDFPLTHKWINSFPEQKYSDISPQQAIETIIHSSYSAPDIGVDAKDFLGLNAGTEVTVENSDTQPGAHPQKGKLVGLSEHETVLELPTGVRLHFPRRGYHVKKA